MKSIAAELATLKPSLPSLCIPNHCDLSSHSSAIPPQELEELLRKYLQDSFIGITFRVFLMNLPSMMENVRALVRSISSSDFTSDENKPVLDAFRKKMKAIVSAALNFSEPGGLTEHFKLHLRFFGSVPIYTGLKHQAWLRALSSQFSEPLITQFGTWYLNLMSKHWDEPTQVNSFELLTIEMESLIGEGLKSSLVKEWTDFVFATLSSSRIIQYAIVMHDISLLNDWDIAHLAPDENTVAPSLLYNPLVIWWEARHSAGVLEHLTAESLKDIADEFAKEKSYLYAVGFYDTINFLGIGLETVLAQSLCNCALLRLLTAKEQPYGIPVAIFEATRVLEIEPNNTKALFRRGLALALMKRWNQAIVDFERALELDPHSPAKKELEVARRQVTRRIGN